MFGFGFLFFVSDVTSEGRFLAIFVHVTIPVCTHEYHTLLSALVKNHGPKTII